MAARVMLLLLALPAGAQEAGPGRSAAAERASADTLVEMGSRGFRVHDPSTIVKCGDEYWLFATGRGIASHHSKDLKSWEPGPAVFGMRPAWTLEAVPEHRGGSQGYFWAPDVIYAGGRYLVYYSVSTFGRNTSAIGVASNVTLDPADSRYKWDDHGAVIASKASDDFNAIDPAVMLDRDGRMWMSFGSFWSGIKLIELDPKTGKRIAADAPMHSIARSESIEAACIVRHEDRYYLFVNWGICCRGVRSTYNIRVGRSGRITGPYLDREGKDLLKGGGTLVLGSEGPMIGPGHAGILSDGPQQWLSFHFYDPTRRGAGTLALRKLSWDKENWPVVQGR